MAAWRRRLLVRKSSARFTWPFRLGLLALIVLVIGGTQRWWTPWLAGTLVCQGPVERSDALMLENFDPNYLVFERAEALQKAGLAGRVLVPVQSGRTPGTTNPVSIGIADVMARQAGLTTWEPVPFEQREPISLNAVVQIRAHLERHAIKSVIIVTPGFRSRRSMLVYKAVLGPYGPRVQCEPVFGQTTPANWIATWHGMQDVAVQFLKLQYYRLYVLPLRRVGRYLTYPFTRSAHVVQGWATSGTARRHEE